MSNLNKRLMKNNNNSPHLIVQALAGTGKTTTLVEGLKVMKGETTEFDPSPQQALIWETMQLSADAESICFVAFNKSIAKELQARVPKGCAAMTLHSLGRRAVVNAYGQLQMDNKRVEKILMDIMGFSDVWKFRRNQGVLARCVEKLVSLCKMNLLFPVEGSNDSDEALERLASHYDIDLNGSRQKVLTLVPQVIEACLDLEKYPTMNFDDMIWFPVALNLPTTLYDLLLVDESQDLNRCQQALAKKSGSRLILVGDEKQAIYGFAGADSESMARLQEELSETDRGCNVLPLTVTRRCGKAIVKEAQKLVPSFKAHETCPEGLVLFAPMKKNSKQDSYTESTEDGDMILCRVNAPLVSECFQFIRAGRKANIRGRNVAEALISTIKKQQAVDVVDLAGKLSDWVDLEVEKEQRKRNPIEARVIALQDRYACLCVFMEGQKLVDQVIESINKIFSDTNQEGVTLSSIHKAKGLEAKRVFLLEPEGATVPHPMAKSKWQIEQEWNLRYVAITRTIEELVYVS